MLLVKTFLNKSTIEGIGLFASEPITKGTALWEWNSVLDMIITVEEALSLPTVAREFVWIHSMLIDNSFHLPGDSAIFINHSLTPNTLWDEKTQQLVANKDIDANDELTESYAHYNSEESLQFFESLGFSRVDWR